MKFPLDREAALVDEINADPRQHYALPDADYHPGREGRILVFRDGLREFLHRRLYRLLVNPALDQKMFLLLG